MTQPLDVRITRDALLDLTDPKMNEYTVEFNGYRVRAARARILFVDGNAGYAETLRGRQLVRFVRRGRKVIANQVLVEIQFPEDLGDRMGTLRFNRSAVRGWVHRNVFGL